MITCKTKTQTTEKCLVKFQHFRITMWLHASNFGIRFLSHNIKIFNSYKPFLKLENRVFILKKFDGEESIVPPPIHDCIILRDNKQHSNSFETELRLPVFKKSKSVKSRQFKFHDL